jgi:hypothetical protein
MPREVPNDITIALPELLQSRPSARPRPAFCRQCPDCAGPGDTCRRLDCPCHDLGSIVAREPSDRCTQMDPFEWLETRPVRLRLTAQLGVVLWSRLTGEQADAAVRAEGRRAGAGAAYVASAKLRPIEDVLPREPYTPARCALWRALAAPALSEPELSLPACAKAFRIVFNGKEPPPGFVDELRAARAALRAPLEGRAA